MSLRGLSRVLRKAHARFLGGWARATASGYPTHEKGTRGHPLTEEQKAANRIKSKTRVRVEHVFGAQHAMGGHIVRTIGLARAKVKIGMMNLVYNMKRLVQLIKRDVSAAMAGSNPHGRGASAVG